MHLHMGLTVGNYIMDYFGRGINFRTTYQDIANDWFNGSINNPINWSLFKDLSFNNGNMFSNGDRIIFTGEQNIRVGSGLKYRVESSTYAGMKATIIGDSRVADGYTWYDIQVDGGGTGWVADVNKFVKLTDENTNNNDGSGNIPPSMDDVQSLKQELEQLRKLVDEGKEAYSNLTKEKEELVKELDHAKVCNADLLAHSKEVTEENDKLRQDLAKYQKTVLDLEEKLSGHQVIDGYSTTELLREIVKRIFTPGDN